MFTRLAADRLNALALRFPGVIILGARQVGKTTLARHAFPDLSYLDCEDPATAASLREDARFVLAGREKRGLIIDEAQAVGAVLPAVRGLIDEQRARNGRFVILGCFNPYLETDLGPTKEYTLDGKTYPADPTAGTRTNCMNCHRRAGYPAFEKDNPASANFGQVFNDGYRSPDDPYFAPLVKTDFLWSIALKAVAAPRR